MNSERCDPDRVALRCEETQTEQTTNQIRTRAPTHIVHNLRLGAPSQKEWNQGKEKTNEELDAPPTCTAKIPAKHPTPPRNSFYAGTPHRGGSGPGPPPAPPAPGSSDLM
ncbi:unnamed protein product [Pleuronectes platessa]|uniref:Uncharacterized protein n=1 Tax=Pleuronectes platessa TaxID=8262 RepID=A0A9N7Z018_PLEPL|nr:unnamed protein product [Pleuronectes platessa]